MNARLAAVVTALETLVVVGIGLGIFFAPLTVMWALDDAFSTDLVAYWRAAADFWLLGHGVPLDVSLGSETAAALGLLPSQASFVLSVAPLGPAVLTLWWGIRMGRRDLAVDYPVVVWVTALVSLLGLSYLIAWSAQHTSATFPFLDAVVLPSVFLSAGLVIASWSTKWSAGRQWLAEALPEHVQQILATGVKAGIASVAMLWGVVSLGYAGGLVFSYATVIGLFESLSPSIPGLVVLFVGQLALVPTIVAWLTAWAVGPGFQLGQAAQFSPLGTEIQAVPALPLLGALPGAPVTGYTVIMIPVLSAIVAGALAERTLNHRVGEKLWRQGETALLQQPVLRGVLTTLIGTAVAVGIALIPIILVSGSLGPGRFATVGVDVGAFASWWSIEVAAGIAVGLGVSRVLRWIRQNEQAQHRQVSR
mgnify:CR=1 FL=1